MDYKSFAEIERDNQDIYEEGLDKESERLSKLVGKEIEVTKIEGDGYGESEEVTFMYRHHEYSIEFLYGMPAGYNDRQFIELINEIDKELEEELKDMYSPKQALNNIRYHYFNGDREHNDIETERFWFKRTEQALKRLEQLEEEKQSFDRVVEKKLAIIDRLQMILGAETIDDLPDLALKIDNKCYSVCYELEQAKSKLKALEIIKRKKVDVGLLLANSLDTYNQLIFVQEKQLTQEEYDVLKEVLG